MFPTSDCLSLHRCVSKKDHLPCLTTTSTTCGNPGKGNPPSTCEEHFTRLVTITLASHVNAGFQIPAATINHTARRLCSVVQVIQVGIQVLHLSLLDFSEVSFRLVKTVFLCHGGRCRGSCKSKRGFAASVIEKCSTKGPSRLERL